MIKLPDELKPLADYRQWVLYRLESRPGDPKPAKVPYDPKNPKNRAKANDPATWASLDEATAALHTVGTFNGLGFQFANGVFGVDLDGCRDPETGTLSPAAIEIIETLDTYTEVSPSGTGVHMLMFGEMPDGKKRIASSEINAEMYDRARYFTITGQQLGKRPISERTEKAKQVHTRYFTPERQETPRIDPGRPAAEITDTDAELLTKARNSVNGAKLERLWSGNDEDYNNDTSRADQAFMNYLAYWTNGDGQRMDSLYRQSNRYRPKWDEMHGERTYGEMTIDKALEDFTPWAPGATGTPYTVETQTTPPGQSSGAAKQSDPTQPTAYSTINTAESNKVYISEARMTADRAGDYLKNQFAKDIHEFGKYKDRKTGFPNLDSKIRGLYPGLYVIGAISSLGKTTFIHQMADQMAAVNEDHVLFFSLEQNRMEMISKSLSRESAKINHKWATSAINIRAGEFDKYVAAAQEEYAKIADRISIIECSFRSNIDFITEYVKTYIEAYNVKPVVIVDYLQIIPGKDGSKLSEKEKTDQHVRRLKLLQSDNDLVVIVVSSMNRANYLTPVDFESFKESGGIEYTADVVWGLQLQVLNNSLFDYEKKIKEKREAVKHAKKAIPRKIELICLKNRYGISSYSLGFNYDARYDLFTPDNNYDRQQERREATARTDQANAGIVMYESRM